MPGCELFVTLSRFAALIALASCGSAHSPVTSGTVVGNASAADPTCDLHGQSVWLPGVTVLAAPDWEIDLEGVTAQTRIPAHAAPLTIRVTDPLEFTVRRDGVWLTLADDLVAADGMVRLSRGARIVAKHSEGDQLVGDIVLVAATPHERAPAVLPAQRIPCKLVSFDEPPRVPGLAAAPPPTNDVWIPQTPGSSIDVRAEPGAGATLMIANEPVEQAREDRRTFRVLEERNGWLRVETTGPKVSVTGWVERTKIVPRAPDWVDYGGGHSGMTRPFIIGPKGEIAYRGPATLKAGSELRMITEPVTWARARHDVEVRVLRLRSEPFVRVTSVPGLGGSPLLGAVAPEQLVFPPSAP